MVIGLPRAVITVVWCEVFFLNIPLPCAGALLVGMCSLPTEDCGMFLVGSVEGVEKATQKLKGWIHWQARQAFVSMLPGIRTYGIPIDQHINQITKQRNAQDYIGRSEALSVGRIWVGKLNERHVTWNLLLRWLGEFDLKINIPQKMKSFTPFFLYVWRTMGCLQMLTLSADRGLRPATVLLHLGFHLEGIWSVWRHVFPTDNSSCPPLPLLSRVLSTLFLGFLAEIEPSRWWSQP